VELGFVFMAKVYVLVDGFNLYHTLDTNPTYHRYKWLSLTKLSKCFVLRGDSLAGVEYFTTLATWDQAKVARHRLFIKANEVEGVKSHLWGVQTQAAKMSRMFKDSNKV
jgi:hypothetical protein